MLRTQDVFGGRDPADLSIYYRSNQKAWMNQIVFFEWLTYLSTYVAQTPGRRIALVIDNATCHGNSNTIPKHSNIEVVFLPKNTTSRIQPLDAGVIACIKRRYRGKQVKRAVQLIENGGVDNFYSTDLLTAIRSVSEIWRSLDASIIRKCWRKTGIIDSGSVVGSDEYFHPTSSECGLVGNELGNVIEFEQRN